MIHDEIIRKIIDYLMQHFENIRGCIGQEPYKKDLFALFKIAYENDYFSINASPRLTADNLRNIISERAGSNQELREIFETSELLNDFCKMWKEWQYALDNY